MEEKPDIELEQETEDLASEETEMVDEEATSADKQKRLREKLKACEQDKMKAMEDLHRARADFLNARKRLEEERLRERQQASVRHIESLLPIVDSFDLALADDIFTSLSVDLQKGINGIYAQLSSILKDHQVTVIGAEGEDFDPNKHEAVANVKVTDKEKDHKVMAVVQNGYQMKDTVIRPARVSVGVLEDKN